MRDGSRDHLIVEREANTRDVTYHYLAASKMTQKSWMIYGANGYTGRLLAEKAAACGDTPILAGRNEAKIKPIAQQLGLPFRCFGLDNPAQCRQALEGVGLVLHCAGPFSSTSAAMVEACLANRCHYLDITGEIAVFESIHAMDKRARSAGVVLMPGVGFDVVPTDCLSVYLSQQIISPCSLELAFAGEGATSPGTAKTMVEMFGEGGRVRRNGKIVAVPTAYNQKLIRFSHGEYWCMTLPWGDVATAFYSTGIPNIAVYIAVPRLAAKMMRLCSPLLTVFRNRRMQNLAKRQIEAHIRGPNADQRRVGATYLWGRVENRAGDTAEAWIETPEGYSFTVESAYLLAHKVLAGTGVSGAHTPASLFGHHLLDEIPGVCLKTNICGD